MGAAVALMAASVAGMPVSTSHCLVGSVVGIGLVQTCSGHKGVLELAVLRRIVAGWVATIPLAMVVRASSSLGTDTPPACQTLVQTLVSQRLLLQVTAILFLPTQGYYLSTPAPSEVIVTPGAAGNASTLP